jgi:hypothetical protein
LLLFVLPEADCMPGCFAHDFWALCYIITGDFFVAGAEQLKEQLSQRGSSSCLAVLH